MADPFDDLRRIEMEIERERRVPDPSVPQRTPPSFPKFDPLTGYSTMLPGDLRDFAEQFLQDAKAAAKREERSRIRREMRDAIGALTVNAFTGTDPAHAQPSMMLDACALLTELDRILPEDWIRQGEEAAEERAACAELARAQGCICENIYVSRYPDDAADYISPEAGAPHYDECPAAILAAIEARSK